MMRKHFTFIDYKKNQYLCASSNQKKAGTFQQVGHASLWHDGDPGGNIGSFHCHSSLIESLRQPQKYCIINVFLRCPPSSFFQNQWLSYSGILVDLFKVYDRRGFCSFGLQENETPVMSVLTAKIKKKKKSTDETDLNQGQEQLGEVSGSVSCYIFIQLLLEHFEQPQSKNKNKKNWDLHQTQHQHLHFNCIFKVIVVNMMETWLRCA